MERGERLVLSSVMTALYLRGGPGQARVSRRRWGLVRDAIMAQPTGLHQAAEVLTGRSLWDEGARLAEPGVLEWGLEQVERQRALTIGCTGYPLRWLRVLGGQAPPALWRLGEPCLAAPVSVVGSRSLNSGETRFARSLGKSIIQAGRGLVSGGAIGADTQVAIGALSTGAEGRLTVILPYGVAHQSPDRRVCFLSVCEPTALFTAGQAMERNALIYAFSPLSLIVKSGFKFGGTWNGATDALRRRLSRLAVRTVDGDLASETLCRLGALPMRGVPDALALIGESEGDSAGEEWAMFAP